MRVSDAIEDRNQVAEPACGLWFEEWGAAAKANGIALHKATACVQFRFKASASPRGRDKTPEAAGSPIDQLQLAGVEQDCYPSLIMQTHVAPAQELDD